VTAIVQLSKSLPSCALFARVRGLTLSNIGFDVAAPEVRPAVVFDHVIDAAVNVCKELRKLSRRCGSLRPAMSC